MNITSITIITIIYIVLWIKHLWSKPDLLNTSEHLSALWFQQLWFLQGMAIFLLIADVFYALLKG